MRVCAKCGRESADDARFCAACGAALEPDSPRREERKIVTVVYADLVGSTARAEQLDPEDVRALLAPYHVRVRTELERFGGTVEKFIGDAVVAVFGAPLAHEDDPERAVRAALAIHETIDALNESSPGLDLEVRVGVATGEALVAVGARPEAGEAMVSGDVMNTGARLQSAARAGGVLVGEATFRATSQAIEYGEECAVDAKGKSEPVRAWPAVAPRARFGVDVAGAGRAPLIGRDDELDVLARALARARAQREVQLVTLIGVPGIGKSRLVYELSRIVDDDPELIAWRQGRSLPYGEGVAYWALGEMVKAQAGILESDGLEDVATKLEANVRDLIADDRDAAWVGRHLRPLVGAGGGDAIGHDGREEAFAAWRRYLDALGDRMPTVLVFEDLHWADDGLLDFVDALADRASGVPLVIVCSARPELLERRSGWGGGKRNATTVSLAPLKDDETARLLAALLDRTLLDAEEQAELLRRAGGNPLYAEEYVRMLEAGGERRIPETLQGIIASRIDGLSADEKDVIRTAAVLGKVFWTDALSAVSGLDEWHLGSLLHSLERKEFIRRERRSAVAGAEQFAFLHVLVRDVAYGQLTRSHRGDLHARVAEWIESLTSDRTDDRAEMLAHHYVSAIELRRAAGVETGDLVRPARNALREAGERAIRLGAPRAALGLLQTATELDPTEEDPHLLFALGRALFDVAEHGLDQLERAVGCFRTSGDFERAARAECVLGDALWRRGEHDRSLAHLREGWRLVAGLQDTLTHAVVGNQLARALALNGQNAEALPLAEHAIAFAERVGDDDLLTSALNTRGTARVSSGDRRGIADVERALAVSVGASTFERARSFTCLASLSGFLGDLRRAEALYREGYDHARRFEQSVGQRWLGCELAVIAYEVGRWDDAQRELEDFIASCRDVPHYMEAPAWEALAGIRFGRGDDEGALAAVERAVELARQIDDPQAVFPTLAYAANLFARLGRGGESAAFIEELRRARTERGRRELAAEWAYDLGVAMTTLDRSQEFLDGSEELGPPTRWLDAGCAVAAGDPLAAAEILAEIGSSAKEADARLWAAEVLIEEGKRSQADRQLNLVLEFAHAAGATALTRMAEALLRETG